VFGWLDPFLEVIICTKHNACRHSHEEQQELVRPPRDWRPADHQCSSIVPPQQWRKRRRAGHPRGGGICSRFQGTGIAQGGFSDDDNIYCYR
jgi:hypothetical protein